MSNLPSEDEYRQIWRDLIINSAEDEFDREMIALADAEENAGSSRRRRGSRRERESGRRYVNRERESGHDRLVRDYFVDVPIFGEHLFCRHFRMHRQLFLHIVDALSNHSTYFQQRQDACGRNGLSPLQKCTAAIRQLAYAAPGDSLDEYMRMGESTALECLHKFCHGIVDVFGPRYLRMPTNKDIQRLLQMYEERHRFPGMLGSLDCMHWTWRNCLVAWKCMFTRGDHDVPIIVLEAVASQDLWIWHAFFGVAGSSNDINVLHGSPLFNYVLYGFALEVRFTVNGTTYDKGYYLTDGIYPEWASFIKSFPVPQDDKRKKFKERQESARKDVERAFGVLQSRWAIIRGPARSYFKEDLTAIIYVCIIMHNMIIENEGTEAAVTWSDEDTPPPLDITMGSNNGYADYIQNYDNLTDKAAHFRLQADLTEHILQQYASM